MFEIKINEKVVITTPFIDIARTAAIALARDRWPEESRFTQEVVKSEIEIYENGIPYAVAKLVDPGVKVWRIVDVK